MAKFHAANVIYSAPDLYTARLISAALSVLSALPDRTEQEKGALELALKLEKELAKEAT